MWTKAENGKHYQMTKKRCEKRECEICSKGIEVYKERLKVSRNKNTEVYLSDEAVYFEEGGVWFCNGCFVEMTKDIFKGEKDEE